MGWAIGFDNQWNRDVGYGVPAYCDHPNCTEEIDRGLSYVCGTEPYGGDHGCGLHFCSKHMPAYRKPRGSDRHVQLCARCERYRPPFTPKPDHPEWMRWKLRDYSWKDWRDENPNEVAQIRNFLRCLSATNPNHKEH